ncbi:MAG: hypothetical protein ACI3ZK_04600 [Candidatus Cryptobacteroides sp.]
MKKIAFVLCLLLGISLGAKAQIQECDSLKAKKAYVCNNIGRAFAWSGAGIVAGASTMFITAAIQAGQGNELGAGIGKMIGIIFGTIGGAVAATSIPFFIAGHCLARSDVPGDYELLFTPEGAKGFATTISLGSYANALSLEANPGYLFNENFFTGGGLSAFYDFDYKWGAMAFANIKYTFGKRSVAPFAGFAVGCAALSQSSDPLAIKGYAAPEFGVRCKLPKKTSLSISLEPLFYFDGDSNAAFKVGVQF